MAGGATGGLSARAKRFVSVRRRGMTIPGKRAQVGATRNLEVLDSSSTLPLMIQRMSAERRMQPTEMVALEVRKIEVL